MSYHMISFVFMYSHLYVIIVFFVYFIFSIKHEYRFIPLLITAQNIFNIQALQWNSFIQATYYNGLTKLPDMRSWN